MVICSMLVTSFVEDFPERKLPFKSWLPYSYSSVTQFALGYVYLSYTLGTFATIGVGIDTLIFGLMLQTCAQLKILKHRLLKIPRLISGARSIESEHKRHENFNLERKMITQCIQHQSKIFR